MKKNIKSFVLIFLISILLSTHSKTEVNNKIVISVGNEIITNYDIDREMKYLSVITAGQFKELDNKEAKKIAIDSLIKDKIKLNIISGQVQFSLRDETINSQMYSTSQKIGFNNIEDFKSYLEIQEYKFDEFIQKIIIELKWNQLVYRFYRNQIVIDKKKIDEELKEIISNQVKKKEYLIHEIFIEDSNIKKINEQTEEIKLEDKPVEKTNGIIIEAENISYDGKKKKVKEEVLVEINEEEKIKYKLSIEELLENIKKEGFESTATNFSTSPTAEIGGSLGWINENELSDILLKFIKDAKIGKITQPIEVPGGILILKVKDKRIKKEEIDLDKKMKELVDVEKNRQLTQFSSNYFNQAKNSIKVKYFDD